jgi:hypothetical protein
LTPAIRHRFEVERPDYSVLRDGGERPPLATRQYVLSLFVSPLCYVQMVSDGNDKVVGYSVTTRSTSFHPTLWFPTYQQSSFPARLRHFLQMLARTFDKHAAISRGEWVRMALRYDAPIRPQRQGCTRIELGRTTFKHARPTRIPRIHAARGNKHWSYVEAYWEGNPGYYQYLVLAASRVSPAAREPEGIENIDWQDRPWRDADRPDWIARAHAVGVITTMAVIGMGFEPENWPVFGPTVDEVRTLP